MSIVHTAKTDKMDCVCMPTLSLMCTPSIDSMSLCRLQLTIELCAIQNPMNKLFYKIETGPCSKGYRWTIKVLVYVNRLYVSLLFYPSCKYSLSVLFLKGKFLEMPLS